MSRLMTIPSVLVAGMLTALAAAAAPPDRELREWGPGSAYGRLWDSKSVISFEGEITSVFVIHPRRSMRDGLAMMVRTDGKTPAWILVHLGPRWYVDAHASRFVAGQHVKVTGSLVKMGQRWVVMASEILREDEIIFLRDERGEPLWWSPPQVPAS